MLVWQVQNLVMGEWRDTERYSTVVDPLTGALLNAPAHTRCLLLLLVFVCGLLVALCTVLLVAAC